MRKTNKLFSVVIALIATFCLTACFASCNSDVSDSGDSSSGGSDKITVAFDRETLTMDEWTTERIGVSASDNSAVNVTASDSSILYVRGSNVTALKEGTATLTAVSVKDETATASMTVVVNAKPENKPVLTVTGADCIALEEKTKFGVSLSGVDSGDYTVSWSVSDGTMAKIDKNGNVTGKLIGSVDVCASVQYRSVEFTAKKTVEIYREITLVFGASETSCKLALAEIAEVDGEYTLTVNGKTYTAEEGYVTFIKSDFDTSETNKFDGTLVCGSDTYAFKLVVVEGSANIYQGGKALTPDANGYYTLDAENSDKTLTFDSSAEKVKYGFTKLRVSVKFSKFDDGNITLSNGQSYAFGYKYKTFEAGWYNRYNHREDLYGAYVGAFPEGGDGSPVAYGYLRVYNAFGEKIFEHYEVADWSSAAGVAYGYIDPLSTDTVYIFEFDVEKTGDITLIGFDYATITKIEWINNANVTLSFEQTQKTVDEWTEFIVNATASDGSSVVYTADSSDVLYVDGNKVIGLKAGTAKIIATANGKTAEMTVTVTENAAKRPELTVEIGSEVEIGDELVPEITLASGETTVSSDSYTLSAVSSDEALASASNGRVVGIASGEVKITFTATYCGVEFKKSCTITVKQAGVPVDHSVGKIYQGSTQLVADDGGNYTMSADISDKTITFDSASSKTALGYTKLRISVKFSTLNDRRIAINGDSYDFGYYYNEVKVGWYNSYATSGAYVGAFNGDDTSPLAYGYLRVYNADGEKIFEHYEFSGWSSSGYGYITPLAVNTVYVFEFDIAKTGDITLVGFENATFTKIEWVDTVNATVSFGESEKTVDEWTGFTVKATSSDWSANVVYTTENTDVISISGNKVIGLKAGTATVTATANGKTAQLTVTVTENAEKRPALAATMKNEIEIAESVGVTATLTSGTTVIDSADYVLSIVSADEGIAKIQSGSVVGVAAGTVKITVTAVCFGVEFEKEIELTVRVAENPAVGKLYQGGTQLVADENGVYKTDTTVDGDSEGKRWLTVDDAKSSTYPYLRFKVKFNSFVSTSQLVGYDYHFGFNYGAVRFFWCNNYAGGGFGGALDASNSATQHHYFNIYTASDNAKVLNAMDTAGWTSYYTLSTDVEYVFEFNVGAMGGGFTFCGFDDAEITDITWAESLLG